MIEVFNKEKGLQIKRAYKHSLMIMCISLLISLIACVTLCFFINDSTAVLINILTCSIFTLCGFVSLTFLFVGILPNKKILSLYSEVFTSEKYIVTCKVIDISKQITVIDNVRCFEITVLNDVSNNVFRFISDECELEIDKTYTFSIYKEWIVAYERKD